MNVDDAVICRLKKQGMVFEVLCDCDKTMAFKHGKASFDDAIVTADEIFKDIKKGDKVPEKELNQVFGTENKREVAEKILKDGEVQLTAEYKNKLRETKKKEIISLISRNAVDPKSNLPHPPQRIENAMQEAKVNINETKSAEEQIKDIVSQINSIIPIAYEIKTVEITVPADVSGKCYPVLKQYTTVARETWNNDGSLTVVVEVPAGLQNELYDKLNNIAQGRIESKIIEK